MKKHTNTLSAPTASTAALLLLLLLLTLTVGACRPDELMTDDGGTLPPGSNGNPGIPASVCIVAGELPAYTEPAHTATRTTPEGNAWADGDVVTAYISYYSDDAGTQPIDIDGTGITTAVQTLTFKAATAGSGTGTGTRSNAPAPQGGTPSKTEGEFSYSGIWTAQPLVLPLPAGLRSLRVSYRHTGAEDALTGTSEFVTGHLAEADYPNSPSVLEGVPEGRGRSSSVLEAISHIQPPTEDALKAILHPTDPASLDPSSLVVISDPAASITLPAPVWTRRTARVIVKAVQVGQTVIANVPRLATLSATRTAPTADNPAPTAADAVFHLLVPKTPLSPNAPAGTPDGFTLFDADLGLLPADNPRAPLYRNVAYAPGQAFLVSATGLHPGSGGDDQQGTVKASGLYALDENVFNKNNPTWIVSGGEADGISGSGADATVLNNVRTAMGKITDENGNSGTSYSGPGIIDLTLPEVTTLPMRDLNYGTFDYYRQLRSVNLPAVTTIGKQAFRNCTALTSAYLPSATSIGEWAFSGCKVLTSAYLPKVTGIEEKAFYNCSALTSAYLPVAKTIGNMAFSSCEALTSAYLPKVTDIGEKAFSYCEALTSVSLPVAKTIGSMAFWYCIQLTSVSLPAATSIGNSTFFRCEALTFLSLPVATSIEKEAFNLCDVLTSLDLSAVTQISDTDGLHSGAFTGFGNSANCDLVLNEAMRNSTTDTDGDGKPDTFCNLKWKSITFKQK